MAQSVILSFIEPSSLSIAGRMNSPFARALERAGIGLEAPRLELDLEGQLEAPRNEFTINPMSAFEDTMKRLGYLGNQQDAKKETKE
jgi:hypothetical protein